MSVAATNDPPLSIRILRRIGEVVPEDWNACAGSGNPTLSHDYFRVIESSGMVGEGTGIEPRYLAVGDAAGMLCAAVPAFLRRKHGISEFAEAGWAQAYEDRGGRYYPSLSVECPMMPVTGSRLLLRDPADDALRHRLVDALSHLAAREGLSSVHVFHPAAVDLAVLREAGWLIQKQRQFHWTNRGYRSFEDFLAAMKKDRRHAVRKERREVCDQGISQRIVTGAAIDPRHCRAFLDLHTETARRKGTVPRLTLRFLEHLAAAMADRMMLIFALHGERPVGAALYLLGPDTLYCRHWGSTGAFRFIHFETNYYQAIEYAIARGLSRIEGGVGGEHKLARGFLPEPVWAAHRLFDPVLHRAVARYLDTATRSLDAGLAASLLHSPFKRDRTAPAEGVLATGASRG